MSDAITKEDLDTVIDLNEIVLDPESEELATEDNPFESGKMHCENGVCRFD